MAGDWIKMDVDLPEKPEVVMLASTLRMTRFEVVGRLHRFWSWWNKHSVNGHAVGVTEAFLDELVSCDGFSAALRKVDWLQARSGSLVVPHFDRHNSHSAKERAQANARKKRSRDERDKCHGESVTKTGPEKRREEKNNYSPPSAREAPTLAEVKAAAANLGIPADVAATFFHDCESRPLAPSGMWTTKQGQEMGKWQSALQAYAQRWQSNDRAKMGTHLSKPRKDTGAVESNGRPPDRALVQRYLEQNRMTRQDGRPWTADEVLDPRFSTYWPEIRQWGRENDAG